METAMIKLAVKYAIARLREPSTYAGVAGALVTAHIAAPGWAPAAIQILGIAFASVASLVMGEQA